MFKKSKNKSLISHPTALTVEEILSDIETFHLEIPASASTILKTRQFEATGANSLNNWWQQFEEFVDKLKNLQVISTEINGYKLKLESSKLEIETQTKMLKNDIEDQQQLIRKVCDYSA